MYYIKEYLGKLGIPLRRKYTLQDIIELGAKVHIPSNMPFYPDGYKELGKECKELRRRNEELETKLGEARWWLSNL